MTKSELAKMLGVSPSMVSRLAKRGMPVDSLERALRWRKRHLEPGRMKGQRYDPNEAPPKPAPVVSAPIPVIDPEAPFRWTFEAGLRDVLAITAADAWALLALPVDAQPEAVTEHVRRILWAVSDEHWPPLPVGLWVRLLDHCLADYSAVRTWPEMRDAMTLDELAQVHRQTPGIHTGSVDSVRNCLVDAVLQPLEDGDSALPGLSELVA